MATRVGHVASTYVPPGWEEWGGPRQGMEEEDATYFDYELNENGRLLAYGIGPGNYLTDVLAAKAAAFIAQSAKAEHPFCLYLAPFAPNDLATPAPRHVAAFSDPLAPGEPSFDEADVSDRPAWIRDQAAFTPEEVVSMDARYRLRPRSLLAVNDLVATVVVALQATATLETTYVVFTSDNGFHLDVHRMANVKRTPYEEAIRVPLVVRGPGVPTRPVVEELVLNIDLAPTVAELAGIATRIAGVSSRARNTVRRCMNIVRSSP